MLRMALIPVGLAAMLALASAPRPANADEPSCTAPRELIEDEPRLPKLAERLKRHLPVVVIVIGGASTAGSAPDNSYPYFLEIALRRRHPGVQINVFNRGIGREVAAQMEARFAKDVLPYQPTLVVWETGTVDAVRNEDVNDFVDTLTQGIDSVTAHNSEIMLMDMQYNPGTASVINFEPYLAALHQTAQLQDVYMFQRFDLMKYWSEAGVFNFIDVPREKRISLAREFYECLGERLAEAIDFAAR